MAIELGFIKWKPKIGFLQLVHWQVLGHIGHDCQGVCHKGCLWDVIVTGYGVAENLIFLVQGLRN